MEVPIKSITSGSMKIMTRERIAATVDRNGLPLKNDISLKL
jgi:hypothetical protein